MILCDTGPLIALIHIADPNHQRCSTASRSLQPRFITTWPCVAEAMHFLGRAGGWPLQFQLWRLRDRGVLQISELTQAHERRMQELMERYKNVPMDLADSSLVAISESLKLMRIFTLDSDFRIYRTADGGTFDIVP